MARLTGAACRAARALLRWSVRDLAREAGVSPTTVNLLENDRPFREGTAAALRGAFERHGVEITNGEGTGARLRFVEAWAHQRDNGEWVVAVRWKQGDPIELVAPPRAVEAAREARARGDVRLAEGLEVAAKAAGGGLERSGA